MDGLVKLAADEKQDNTQAALGLAGVAGGAYAVNKALPKIDGMERLYHGTGKANARNIKEQGLLASKAGEGVPSQRVDLASRIGQDNVAGKTYTTRNKNYAGQYALQNAMAGKGGQVVPVRIPYRDLQAGKLKEVANPELRGMNVDEFVEHLRPELIEQLYGGLDGKFTRNAANGILRKSYKGLDTPNTLVIEGDIEPKYIKGSSQYQGQTLSGLADYIQHNPRRFAKGVGLAGLGAGGVGLGLNEFIESKQNA